jgi:hypothetical protein
MRHILFGVIVGVVVLVGNIVLNHMDLPHTFWVQALVCGFAGLIASLVYHRQTSRTDQDSVVLGRSPSGRGIRRR